jgi:SNF2 family DNA or RNA helicase
LYAEIDSGEITVANAMVKVLRLQQLTSGYLKTDEGELVQYGNEKLNLFKELLGEIPAKEPVVIFCRFTSDIANVKAACKDAGRTCAELSGHENSLAEWQDGKYDCIAVQIRSGGVGIDLTRACYCVYYSMGHSLGDFSQSLARTNRPGQTRTVRYYHLLAEGTVDPTIYQALSKKQKVVDYILKGVKVNVSDLD